MTDRDGNQGGGEKAKPRHRDRWSDVRQWRYERKVQA